MAGKCVKLWCWGCGKAPSGETGEPPFCLGCGEMVGECGMSAGPCGYCYEHCIDVMAHDWDGIRGLSVPERRQKLIDDEARDYKAEQQKTHIALDWDEIERQVMKDLYGEGLDGLDLGVT